MTAAAAPPVLAAEDMAYLGDLLHREAGIVLGADKAYLVLTQLDDVARDEGARSVVDLVTGLRRGTRGPLHDRVVQALTINETSFFRDVHPWNGLAESVLPELVARRAGDRRLVAWSAACSTGQEPYSLAILLRTAFPQLAGWDVRVVATDLSADVVDRARQGIYSRQELERGMPAHLIDRVASPVGDGRWQLSAEIRRAVRFTTSNLTSTWPALPPVDLLLLRNVLIYFDLDLRRSILERARRAMATDGFLLLGTAESPVQVDAGSQRDAGWRRDVRGATTWYRPMAAQAV